MCAHTRRHTDAHTHMHVHTHIHTLMRTHTHMHAHMQTHTHPPTHYKHIHYWWWVGTCTVRRKQHISMQKRRDGFSVLTLKKSVNKTNAWERERERKKRQAIIFFSTFSIWWLSQFWVCWCCERIIRIIRIIKMISRAPTYRTRWEHRVLYINTNNTHSTHTHAHTRAHTHTCTHSHTHAHTHAHTHMHTLTHTHACIHIHTRAFTVAPLVTIKARTLVLKQRTDPCQDYF